MEFYHFIVGVLPKGRILPVSARRYFRRRRCDSDRARDLPHDRSDEQSSSVERSRSAARRGQLQAGHRDHVALAGAIATVLKYGIARLASARRRDDIQKAMDESLLEIVPRMEKRTHYLSALANIGMLIGLLGTIIGLIHAFASVAQANPAEKAELLAAAISVAMNNTASGLVVAITLLLAHMFLEAKTTSLIDSLEIAAVKFLNSVTERHAEPDSGEPAPRAEGTRLRARRLNRTLRCIARHRLATQARSRESHGSVQTPPRDSQSRSIRGRKRTQIVPMIDMMVILVFFLMFTAVFTNTNILELNLPGADNAVPDLPEGLNLEVIVRKAASKWPIAAPVC